MAFAILRSFRLLRPHRLPDPQGLDPAFAVLCFAHSADRQLDKLLPRLRLPVNEPGGLDALADVPPNFLFHPEFVQHFQLVRVKAGGREQPDQIDVRRALHKTLHPDVAERALVQLRISDDVVFSAVLLAPRKRAVQHRRLSLPARRFLFPHGVKLACFSVPPRTDCSLREPRTKPVDADGLGVRQPRQPVRSAERPGVCRVALLRVVAHRPELSSPPSEHNRAVKTLQIFPLSRAAQLLDGDLRPAKRAFPSRLALPPVRDVSPAIALLLRVLADHDRSLLRAQLLMGFYVLSAAGGPVFAGSGDPE